VGLLVDLSNHQCLYSEDLKPEMGLTYRHFQFVAKRLPDPASCRMVRATQRKSKARGRKETCWPDEKGQGEEGEGRKDKDTCC
jgi:hypothetical protein